VSAARDHPELAAQIGLGRRVDAGRIAGPWRTLSLPGRVDYGAFYEK